jgi:hypothetical protein
MNCLIVNHPTFQAAVDVNYSEPEICAAPIANDFSAIPSHVSPKIMAVQKRVRSQEIVVEI